MVDKMTQVESQAAEQLTESDQTVGNVRCENPYVVAEDVNVYYDDNVGSA